MDQAKRNLYKYDDFTKSNYRKYLKLARSKYEFISFSEYEKSNKTCLLRHDVDTSPNQALELAIIENQEQIKSTFFWLLHSERYNLLDKATIQIVKETISLGHEVGLHFDPSFYEEKIGNINDLVEYLSYEKKVLENFFQVRISVFSFHNPSLLNFDYSENEISGMVNTYGKNIRKIFNYISDSFCIWRYDRLEDVLQKDNIDHLHVLLHPVCWSKEPLSPFKRFEISVKNRASKTMENYLKIAKKIGREIIK